LYLSSWFFLSVFQSCYLMYLPLAAVCICTIVAILMNFSS
jgi:hypothetical protein